MESTRITQRKRKSQLTAEGQPGEADANNSENKSCSTPRKPKKKVRFSDPGPRAQSDHDENSTGLTPALMRTSFVSREPANAQGSSTPSRPRRRRSTPIPRSRWIPESSPIDESQHVVQFTPLRQMLDQRTRRRIQRAGLSDEINQIQREKREAANYQKTLDALRNERDGLKQALETSRRASGADAMTDQQFEATNQGETEASPILCTGSVKNGRDTSMIDDTDMEGQTILVSNSPDMRDIGEDFPVPEDIPPLDNDQLSCEASTQVQSSESHNDNERIALSHDLEAARKEKMDLFDACRAQVSDLDGTALGNSLRNSTPPPDFLGQIVPTLMAVVVRASNAAQSLDCVKEELSTLGFPGDNVREILCEMRSRFRSARLELEHLVPGETAAASLEDGDATLSALVKRIERLVKSLETERQNPTGSLGREKALKGQFDSMLARYEAASQKIQRLEETISSSAEDMLHTRMRMRELEQEGEEQAIGIDRLNSALTKYRKEVRTLEAIVTDLEDENVKCKELHHEQLSTLQEKITNGEEARHTAESNTLKHEARIQELEGILEQNRIRACDMTAHAESLERERQAAAVCAEKAASDQLHRHEQEIGSMNVRVSELSTSLEAARSELEKLRRGKTGLEEQLQLEVDARNDLMNKWMEDQTRSFAYMKDAVRTNQRSAKVRSANWEMMSDDIQSDNTTPAVSEPITPISMTRHIDVEVGRGKHRRRLDSGIGLLSEDMLDDEEAPLTPGVDLPSDPANL